MSDQQPASTDLPVNILAQYVKDVSFENPHAPESLRPAGATPDMDVNIGMDAHKLEGSDIPNFYEVVLTVKAQVKREDQVMFIVDLQYAAAVSIGDSVPEGGHHPILLIEVPRILFPYAREFVSTLTIHGGYPPLLLNPVDFQALYMQQFGDQIKEAQSKAEAGKSKK